MSFHGYGPLILAGTWETIKLALLSLAAAFVLGLAGAAAKLSPNRVLAAAGTFYTTLIRAVPDLVLMLLLFYSIQIAVNDIMSVRETATHLIEGIEGRARAYVQAQNGCDHRCTFCIIPYGRGPSRSTPIGMIAEQVRALEAGELEDSALDEDARLVLRFTTQVVREASPDEPTFAAISARFSTAEIVQLLLVIGQYMMVGRVMATAQLEVDAVLGQDVLAGIERRR